MEGKLTPEQYEELFGEPPPGFERKTEPTDREGRAPAVEQLIAEAEWAADYLSGLRKATANRIEAALRRAIEQVRRAEP